MQGGEGSEGSKVAALRLFGSGAREDQLLLARMWSLDEEHYCTSLVIPPSQSALRPATLLAIGHGCGHWQGEATLRPEKANDAGKP